MSGYLLNVIHCPDTRKVMRNALDAGWEWVGYTKSGHVEIRWPETDAVIHCATTPSDPNSFKEFARDVYRVSGVTVWAKGNRRRSRKSIRTSDPQVDASRRRFAVAQQRAAVRAEREAAQEEAARRRALATATADQHRREIESLMRPGYGR